MCRSPSARDPVAPADGFRYPIFRIALSLPKGVRDTMFRQLWNAAFKSRTARTIRRTPRRPGLESLEDRCVPASIWIGPENGVWSNPANWSGGVAPGSGSIVQFGSGGANTDSVDDISGLSIGQLNIDNTYAKTVTLNQSLTVTTLITQSGGTIATEGSTQRLVNDNQFNWYGGSLVGKGTLVNPGRPAFKFFPRMAAQFNILGGPLLAMNLDNNGDVNWEDSADLDMSDGAVITNESNGKITISSAQGAATGLTINLNDTQLAGPQDSYFVNHFGGQMIVNTTGSVNIGIGDIDPNLNNGFFTLSQGNLAFTAGLQFKNAGQINDASNNGGTLEFKLPFNEIANTDASGEVAVMEMTKTNLTLDLDDGATLNVGTLSSGDTAGDTETLNIGADLTIDAGAQVVLGANTAPHVVTMDVSGDIYDHGSIIMSSVFNGGRGVIDVGTIFNDATASQGSGQGGIASAGPTCTINGNILNTGVLTAGGFTLNGNYTQDSGTINVYALTVTGLFDEEVGLVNLGLSGQGGSLTASSCTIGGTLDVNQASTITSNVVVNGTITFTGTIYGLTINGNYNQLGTVNMALLDNAIDVTGTASLTGAKFILTNNTVTSPGAIAIIDMVNEGSITGTWTDNVTSGTGVTAQTFLLNAYPNNPSNLDNGLWVIATSP
jgi:fibronectin-binding autotransporter adhesin